MPQLQGSTGLPLPAAFAAPVEPPTEAAVHAAVPQPGPTHQQAPLPPAAAANPAPYGAMAAQVRSRKSTLWHLLLNPRAAANEFNGSVCGIDISLSAGEEMAAVPSAVRTMRTFVVCTAATAWWLPGHALTRHKTFVACRLVRSLLLHKFYISFFLQLQSSSYAPLSLPVSAMCRTKITGLRTAEVRPQM